MNAGRLREQGAVTAASLLDPLPPVLCVPDALARIRAGLVANGTRNVVLDATRPGRRPSPVSPC